MKVKLRIDNDEIKVDVIGTDEFKGSFEEIEDFPHSRNIAGSSFRPLSKILF
jgi:hypothetical protein